MNKKAKWILLLTTMLLNTVFFFLCGYWQDIAQSKYKFIDILFGVLAVIGLSSGITSIIQQIYCRKKLSSLTKRELSFRFPLQCLLLIVYYVGALLLMLELVFNFSVFYLAAFGAFFSLFLQRGSQVLWTGEEKSYYLDETGRLFTVNNINENDDAMELACSIEGDRDRNITIYKRKQYDASNNNDLYQ